MASKANPTTEPERLVIKGHVRTADKSPLVNGVVRAFDRDLGREQFLGETTTDTEGRYEIAYTCTQSRRVEKRRADLVVRVYQAEDPKLLLGESEVIFNARPVEVVDLTVTQAFSEYELKEMQRTQDLVPTKVCSSTLSASSKRRRGPWLVLAVLCILLAVAGVGYLLLRPKPAPQPLVSIRSPGQGQQVAVGEALTLYAVAQGDDPIVRVEFLGAAAVAGELGEEELPAVQAAQELRWELPKSCQRTRGYTVNRPRVLRGLLRRPALVACRSRVGSYERHIYPYSSGIRGCSQAIALAPCLHPALLARGCRGGWRRGLALLPRGGIAAEISAGVQKPGKAG